MDGTSPGNMPMSLGGTVWVGETHWPGTTASPPQMHWVDFPYGWPYEWPYRPPGWHHPVTFTTNTITLPSREISDADVERIAKRVVAMLDLRRNEKAESALPVAADADAPDGSG